jgi:hypothetical protein
MKKFICVLILLVCAGAAVFLAGWVQLALPQGQYGVMETKTNGMVPQVFQAGHIDWRWERLIPKNAKLYLFSSKAYTAARTVSGTLPSAATYSSQMDSKPDFSYSFTITSSVTVKPEALLPLMEKTGIRTQEELDTALAQKSAEIASATVEFLLSRPQASPLDTIRVLVDEDAIRVKINSDSYFSDITLESVSASEVKIPDLELYQLAKESYLNYLAQVTAAVKSAAEAQAFSMVKNNAALERLEKLAELLEKHPTLAELISKNGVIGDTLLSTMVD